MWNSRTVCLAVLLTAGAACTKQALVIAPAGTNSTRGSLDDLCRDAGPDPENVPRDTFQVGSGLISFEKPWFAEPRSNAYRLELSQGIRGQIVVSHDLQRPWPRAYAPSGIECEIVRGADTVLIRGRIENSLGFSVEALWEKPSDKSQLYLRMTTAVPSELKKVRRSIQTAQFPVPDSLTARAR